MSNAPLLTIGMAVHDDYKGLWPTIRSLRRHHSEVMDVTEILVVDNNPTSEDGNLSKRLVNKTRNGRYIEYTEHGGTAQPRQQVFEHARGEIVCCLDPHVLMDLDVFELLLDYFEHRPHSLNLIQGPLIGEDDGLIGTHQEPVWRGHAHGIWDRTTHIGMFDIERQPSGFPASMQPFEVYQQGMWAFACRKEAWVGFHPDFRGFGGCESYIADKFRANGGQVICAPWFTGSHRFGRPGGANYKNDLGDRLRNYLIAAEALGQDPAPIILHFNEIKENGIRLSQNPQDLIADDGPCPHEEFKVHTEFTRYESAPGRFEWCGRLTPFCSKCRQPGYIPNIPTGRFVMEIPG